MEFGEEHEEDYQEEEIVGGPNFESPNPPASGDSASKNGAPGGVGVAYRYRECQKNHAVGLARHAVDGCGEFIAAGDDGTLDALKCAACNCHRNFHRKEAEGDVIRRSPLQQQPLLLSYQRTPAGYLHHHVTPPRPLALPSTVRDDDNFSYPSSSGGRKRHRTKFTAEQKEKMLVLAERLGWRLQKQDEVAVEEFCNDTGLRRQVVKVWMHNNKHILAKKP